jgi:tRNA methyl transferase
MATGHYVRIDSSAEHSGEVGLSAQGSSPLTGLCGSQPSPRLLRGIDDSKDQSYFLSMTRVSHYSCFLCWCLCFASWGNFTRKACAKRSLGFHPITSLHKLIKFCRKPLICDIWDHYADSPPILTPLFAIQCLPHRAKIWKMFFSLWGAFENKRYLDCCSEYK